MRKLISILLIFSLIDSQGIYSDVFNTSLEKKSSLFSQFLSKKSFSQWMTLEREKSMDSDHPMQVLLIRDLHGDAEAQLNVARMLEDFSHALGKPPLVLVEGAVEEVNTSFFGTFPEEEVKRSMTREFVRQGWVTGPEYFSIVQYENFPGLRIWGVEQEKLYVSNFKVFRDVHASAEESENWLFDLNSFVSQLKEKIYHPELLEFDRQMSDRLTGKQNLEGYAGYLFSKIDISPYTNLRIFQEYMRMNQGVDPKRLDLEREKLIQELGGRLDKESLARLVQRSLEFRLGRVDIQSYFDYLLRQANKAGLQVETQFPALFQTAELFKIQAQINIAMMMEEMESAEKNLSETLLKSPEEKTLSKLDRSLDLLKKLSNLQMSRQDLDLFKEQERYCRPLSILENLKRIADGKLGVPESILDETASDSMNRQFDLAVKFYETAVLRDAAMTEETVKKMRAQNTDSAVLIAGGFHTAGIERLLESQGVACAVAIPRVSRQPTEEVYLSRMMDERFEYHALALPSLFSPLIESLSPLIRIGEWENLASAYAGAWVNKILSDHGGNKEEARKVMENAIRVWVALMIAREGKLGASEEKLVGVFRAAMEKMEPSQGKEDLRWEDIDRFIRSSPVHAEITLQLLEKFYPERTGDIQKAKALYQELSGQGHYQKTVSAEKELVEVVDEEGNLTGQIISRKQAHQDGTLHKAVRFLLKLSDGSVILIRRKPGSKIDPDKWDVVGGHVDPGEDFITAAVRELKEETGLEIDPSRFEQIGKEGGFLREHRVPEKNYFNRELSSAYSVTLTEDEKEKLYEHPYEKFMALSWDEWMMASGISQKAIDFIGYVMGPAASISHFVFAMANFRMSAQQKAPGAKSLGDSEIGLGSDFFYRQLRKSEDPVSPDENEVLMASVAMANAIQDRQNSGMKINPDNVFLRVIPEHHFNDQHQKVNLLGIPREYKQGSYAPEDLIYAHADVLEGKLNIYITEAMWERIQFQDAGNFYQRLLAEFIDHEWFERIEAAELDIPYELKHRKAAERARFFASEGDLSPFHEFFISELSQFSDRGFDAYVKGIFGEYRNGRSAEVKAYENRFLKEFHRRVLKGKTYKIQFPEKADRKSKKESFKWGKDETQAVANVRNAIQTHLPFLWLRIMDWPNLDDYQRNEVLKEVYGLSKAQIGSWDLRSAFDRNLAPFFEGSYRTVLMKSLPELPLERLGFGLEWEDDEKTRESILYVLKREMPTLWNMMQKWQTLTEPQRKMVRNEIYRITNAHFSVWGLEIPLNTFLKVFPEMGLEWPGFEMQWDKPEKGRECVKFAIREYRPDLWQKFQKWDALSPFEREKLKSEFYQIDVDDFKTWGIIMAARKTVAPYFKGSYRDALIETFPELNLERRGFGLEWDDNDEPQNIQNVRYVIERKQPVLWRRYMTWAGSESKDLDELNFLKREFYRISAAHFRAWRLAGAFDMKASFGSSHMIALQKSFPELELSVEEMKSLRKSETQVKYYWKSQDEGISHVREVVEAKIQGLKTNLAKWDSLREGERQVIREQFYGIAKSDFDLWGISSALKRDSAPYFEGSYVAALMMSFPELGLARKGFGLTWDSPQDAADSIQYRLKEAYPQFWDMYEKWDTLSEPERRLLKEEVYSWKEGNLGSWGMGQLMTTTLFSSYREALVESLPKMGLSVLGFSKLWPDDHSQIQQAIDNVRFAVEWHRPDLWETIQKYGSLSEQDRKKLREEMYEIKNGHFDLWGISAALNIEHCPYFKGSHAAALMMSFPDLNLEQPGFLLSWKTPEEGIQSVQYVLKQKWPDMWDLYQRWDEIEDYQKDQVRVRLNSLTQDQFILWKMVRALKAPYFEKSHVQALRKSFPKAFQNGPSASASSAQMMSASLAEGHVHYSSNAEVNAGEVGTLFHLKTIQNHIMSRSREVSWNIAGKTIKVYLDERLIQASGMTDQEFLSLLSQALTLDARLNGNNFNALPDVLTFGLLDKSSHLFENHLGDGFVGINPALFASNLERENIRILLQSGLVHELRHEALIAEKKYLRQEYERAQVQYYQGLDQLFDSREAVLMSLATSSAYAEIMDKAEREYWDMDKVLLNELLASASSGEMEKLKNTTGRFLDRRSPLYRYLQREAFWRKWTGWLRAGPVHEHRQGLLRNVDMFVAPQKQESFSRSLAGDLPEVQPLVSEFKDTAESLVVFPRPQDIKGRTCVAMHDLRDDKGLTEFLFTLGSLKEFGAKEIRCVIPKSFAVERDILDILQIYAGKIYFADDRYFETGTHDFSQAELTLYRKPFWRKIWEGLLQAAGAFRNLLSVRRSSQVQAAFFTEEYAELKEQTAGKLKSTDPALQTEVITRDKIRTLPNSNVGLSWRKVFGKNILLIHTTRTNTGLVELLLLLAKMKRWGAADISLVLPFMGYARQHENYPKPTIGGEGALSANSAKIILEIIRKFSPSIHLVNPHFFKDTGMQSFKGISGLRINSLDAFPLIAERFIKKLEARGIARKDIVFVAPDRGASVFVQRVSRKTGSLFGFLEKKRVAVGTDTEVVREKDATVKTISEDGREVDLDVSGKYCILLDDIIGSGGTMITAAEVLSKHGAREIYAGGVHITGNAMPAKMEEAAGRGIRIEELVSSNSVSFQTSLVSVADLIVSSVQREKTRRQDGFIHQGLGSWTEFEARKPEIQKKEITEVLRPRLVAVVKRALESKVLDEGQRTQLEAQLKNIQSGSFKIFEFTSIVKNPEDFFLGHFDSENNELFIPSDLLDHLEERGPPVTDEYLLHEMLCPLFDHYPAIELQQKLQTENYPDQDQLSKQTPEKPYKGALGEALREFIGQRVFVEGVLNKLDERRGNLWRHLMADGDARDLLRKRLMSIYRNRLLDVLRAQLGKFAAEMGRPLEDEDLKNLTVVVFGDFLWHPVNDRPEDIDVLVIGRKPLSKDGSWIWNSGKYLPKISHNVRGWDDFQRSDKLKKRLSLLLKGNGVVVSGSEPDFLQEVSLEETFKWIDGLLQYAAHEEAMGDLGEAKRIWQRGMDAYCFLHPFLEKYYPDGIKEISAYLFGGKNIDEFLPAYYKGGIEPLPWSEPFIHYVRRMDDAFRKAMREVRLAASRESQREAVKTGASTPDGFIRAGWLSRKIFDRKKSQYKKNTAADLKYHDQAILLLQAALVKGAWSEDERQKIEALIQSLKRGEFKIFGFQGIVKGKTDFFLGQEDLERKELFLSEDVISMLETRGPPTLVKEYILHELLCPILGHYPAIQFQQQMYPQHYLDGIFETADGVKYLPGFAGVTDKPFKGLLGQALREYIDDRATSAIAKSIKESALQLSGFFNRIYAGIFSIPQGTLRDILLLLGKEDWMFERELPGRGKIKRYEIHKGKEVFILEIERKGIRIKEARVVKMTKSGREILQQRIKLDALRDFKVDFISKERFLTALSAAGLGAWVFFLKSIHIADGFIRAGEESTQIFHSKKSKIQVYANNHSDLYRWRIKEFSQLLEKAKSLPELTMLEQARLKAVYWKLVMANRKTSLFGFQGIVKGPEDYFLGWHDRSSNSIFIADDLIAALQSRGPASLVKEYLFHELLCPYLGHNQAIFLQQKLFPEHYPEKSKLLNQKAGSPYKGLLGIALRDFINFKAGIKPQQPPAEPVVAPESPAVQTEPSAGDAVRAVSTDFSDEETLLLTPKAKLKRLWGNSKVRLEKLAQYLDKKLPKAYWFNILVITAFAALFYLFGLMDVSSKGAFYWVEYSLESVFNFVFFTILSDVLAKRILGEKINSKSMKGALASGIISGIVTALFFAAIASLGQLWRTLLITFFLVSIRNWIYSKFFHVEGKKEKEAAIANRRFEMFWLSRPISFVKNAFTQVILPFEFRVAVESVLNQWFQQYYAWALHVDRETIVGRPQVLKPLDRVKNTKLKTVLRAFSLMLYTIVSVVIKPFELLIRLGRYLFQSKSSDEEKEGDGFIQKGKVALREFYAYMRKEGAWNLRERTNDYARNMVRSSYWIMIEKVISLLEIQLQNPGFSDEERKRLTVQITKLREKDYSVYLVPAFVANTEDYFLGAHFPKDRSLFLCENLGPVFEGVRSTLMEEYILHEILCPVVGHQRAILFQQKLYSINYPETEKLENQSIHNLYKGLLGEELRKFIDERAANRSAYFSDIPTFTNWPILWRKESKVLAGGTVPLKSIYDDTQVLRGFVKHTPLVHMPTISARTGFNVFVKDEGQQVTGSFKPRILAQFFRPLLGWFGRLRFALKTQVITTGTTGNQGQGVAWAAKTLREKYPVLLKWFVVFVNWMRKPMSLTAFERQGLLARIFTASDTPRLKEAKMLSFGADVQKVDGLYEKARDMSEKEGAKKGVEYLAHGGPSAVSSYGSLGIEMAEDMVNYWKSQKVIPSNFSFEKFMRLKIMAQNRPLSRRNQKKLAALEALLEPLSHLAVIVPIGAGGVASGVFLALKQLNPRVTVIGVATEQTRSMYESVKNGEVRSVPIQKNIYEDGINVNEPETFSLEVFQRYADGVVTVPSEWIETGIRAHYFESQLKSEGASVLPYLALAGYPELTAKLKEKGVQSVVLVSTGRNIEEEKWNRIVGLSRPPAAPVAPVPVQPGTAELDWDEHEERTAVDITSAGQAAGANLSDDFEENTGVFDPNTLKAVTETSGVSPLSANVPAEPVSVRFVSLAEPDEEDDTQVFQRVDVPKGSKTSTASPVTAVSGEHASGNESLDDNVEVRDDGDGGVTLVFKKPDGMIQQGELAPAEFEKTKPLIEENDATDIFQAKLSNLLARVLTRSEIDSEKRPSLQSLQESLSQGKVKIYGFNSIVKGVDDFVLGKFEAALKMYLASDLMGVLKESASLLDEYLLHEVLCPVLGHNEAILMQQILFPENYPDAEKLLDQDISKPYKGKLGDALRAHIDRKVSENAQPVWESLHGNKFLFNPQTGEVRPGENFGFHSGNDYVIVRHGETDWNKEDKYQGSTDIPLNEDGMKQAAAAAEELLEKYRNEILTGKLKVIYSSPLKRALQTAQAFRDLVQYRLHVDLQIKVEDDLKEMNWGDWEGKTREELIASDPVLFERFYQGLDYRVKPPGEKSESPLDVLDRIQKVYERLENRHQGETLLVFGHGRALTQMQQTLGDPRVMNSAGRLNYLKGRLGNGKFHAFTPKLENLDMNGETHETLMALARVVSEFADEAGRLLVEKRAWAKETAEVKPDRTIVTKIDYLIQKLLFERVFGNAKFGGVYIDAEEDLKAIGLSLDLIDLNTGNFRNSDIVISVDPLDGTRMYATTDTGEYGFTLGVLYKGYPVFGVLVAPEYKLKFEANALTDEFKLNGKQLPRFIVPVANPPKVIASKSVSRGREHPLATVLPAFYQVTDRVGSVAVASSTMVARDAALSHDAISSVVTNTYDVIGPAILIDTAGGKVSRLDGTPFFPIRWEDITQEKRHMPMLAGMPEVVDHLVELHAELRRRELLESLTAAVSEHPLGISEKDAVLVVEKAVQVIQEMYGTEFDKEMLLNPERAERWLSPRIEIRRVNGRIVQIVISFKNTEDRDQSLEKIKEKGESPFTYLAAGTKTIEIQTAGINKAVPIGFIENHFDEILNEMGYSVAPDSLINARETKTIVIADADGTIYSRPTYAPDMPLSNLSASAVREPLIEYLEAGGILAVTSGYELEKIRQRILVGIPDDKRHLLSRIIIIASAGATLNVFNSDGSLRELPAYQNALREHSPGPVSKLDVVYFGDDEKREGNDYAAFQKVGFGRAVSVSDEDKVPQELSLNHVGNLEMGMAEVLKAVVQKNRTSAGLPLFTKHNISEFVQTARHNLLPKQISAAAESVLKNGLLGPDFVANALEMRSMMNPLDKDVTMVYGAGGPDVSTAYLSTGFRKAYFLDIYQMTGSGLQNALDRWDVNKMDSEKLDQYKNSKSRGGITVSGHMVEQFAPEFFMIQELKAMGVRKEDIHIGMDVKKRLRLSFKLPEDKKQREIIFVQRNILAMQEYFDQPELNEELKGNVDIYFQKALFVGDLGFDRYIETVSDWIRPGGFMAVDPFTSDGEFHDPFPNLQDGLYRNQVTDTLGKVRQRLYSSEDRMGWVYGYGWDLMVLEKNRTETLDQGPITETRNVEFGKEQEKQVLADIFAHQYGISLGPTLVALDHMGILDMLRRGEFVSMKEILEKTGGSPGYLHVALRLLASAGLAIREGKAGTHDLKYRLTEEGRMVMDVIPQFEKISEFMATAIRLNEMTSRLRIGDFERGKKIFRELIDLASHDWDIPPESDPKRMAMRREIISYLNGLLIGPAMVALGINHIFKDRKVFDPYELGEDNWEFYKMVFDLLSHEGWMKEKDGDYILTPEGTFAVSRAPAYGVTVSYLPLFSRVEELLRGAKFDEIFARDKQGHETHVDREMNVWGSGGAHKTYFKKIDEIVMEIFNRQIEEQPEGIADMGCGDGTLLAHLYEVVKKTKRGQMLDKYPLKIIGADYNEAAREATRKTLQAAGIPQPHIVFGDINDPAGRRKGPNGEEGFAKALEAMGINPKNLLHVRSFLDHNRPYESPEGDYSQRVSESTGAFAYKGEVVTPEALEQNLVEHFKRWAPYVEKFGLLVLELHSIPPELAAKSKGKTLATPYDGTHGYSDQYTIEVPSFVKAAREAGLEPVQEYEAKFPPNNLATVTINVFKVKKSESAGIDQAILDYTQVPVPNEYGELAGEHAVSRGWVDLAGIGGLYSSKEKNWIDDAIESLPADRPAKILFMGAGRGTAILDLLQQKPGRKFEIHTINKEPNLLYDLRNIVEYLDPVIYQITTFEELVAKNDPLIAKAVELFQQIHAHAHVMDISNGNGLDSLDQDFDLVIVGNVVMQYISGYLEVNRGLYNRLKPGSTLFTEATWYMNPSRDSLAIATEIGDEVGGKMEIIKLQVSRDAMSLMITKPAAPSSELHPAVQKIIDAGEKGEKSSRDDLRALQEQLSKLRKADKAALFASFLGLQLSKDGQYLIAGRYEFEDLENMDNEGMFFRVKDRRTNQSLSLKVYLYASIDELKAQEAVMKELSIFQRKGDKNDHVLFLQMIGRVKGKDGTNRLFRLSESVDIREHVALQNTVSRTETNNIPLVPVKILGQIFEGLEYFLKHGIFYSGSEIIFKKSEGGIRAFFENFADFERGDLKSPDVEKVKAFQKQWADRIVFLFSPFLEKKNELSLDEMRLLSAGLIEMQKRMEIEGVEPLAPLLSLSIGLLSYLGNEYTDAQKRLSTFEATGAFSDDLYEKYPAFRKIRGEIAVKTMTSLGIAQRISAKLGSNITKMDPVELIDKIGRIITEDYPDLLHSENETLRSQVVFSVIEEAGQPAKTARFFPSSFSEKIVPMLKERGISEKVVDVLEKIAGTMTFYEVLNVIFKTGNFYSDPAFQDIIFEVYARGFINGYLTERGAKHLEEAVSLDFQSSFESRFGIPFNAQNMTAEYAKARFLNSDAVSFFDTYASELEELFMAEELDEVFLESPKAGEKERRLERIGVILRNRAQSKSFATEIILERELMRLLSKTEESQSLDGGRDFRSFDQAA